MIKRDSSQGIEDYFSSRRYTSRNNYSGEKKKFTHGEQLSSNSKCYSQSKVINFSNTKRNFIDGRNKSSKEYLLNKYKNKDKEMNVKRRNVNRQSTSTQQYGSLQKYYHINSKNKHQYDIKSRNQRLFLNNRQFIILGLIGQGQTAKVYKTLQAKTGFILAIKVIKKQAILKHPKFIKQITRQLKISFFLNHPNIIKVYGIAIDNSLLYVMMELATDSCLQTYIEKHSIFSDRSASIIIREILDGFKTIHENRIIHRDLKPQNIVTILGTVKICDFGWATHVKVQDLAETFCGTPLYFSPQVLLGKKYDCKVDIWSIGVIAFQMLFGKMPFNIRQKKHLTKIITDQIKYQFPQKMIRQCSSDILLKVNFLKSFLSKNPTLRKSVKQLREMEFIRMYQQYELVPELIININ